MAGAGDDVVDEAAEQQALVVVDLAVAFGGSVEVEQRLTLRAADLLAVGQGLQTIEVGLDRGALVGRRRVEQLLREVGEGRILVGAGGDAGGEHGGEDETAHGRET